MWKLLFTVLLQSVWLNAVSANVGLHGADDLFRFVTRPDLMSPKWNITYHQRDRVAPGYWFTTPFTFRAHHLDDVKWVPCQMGPMIYDNDGELVWSGACQFNNRIMYDVVPVELGGRTVLKAIVMNSEFPVPDCGAGLFVDQSYEMVHNFFIDRENSHVNIHDFNYIPRENKTLVTTRRPRPYTGASLGLRENLIWIDSNGIRAYDLTSGNVTFDWLAEDHIGFEESTMQPAHSVAPLYNKTRIPYTDFHAHYLWDPWHINSVDENSDGNYLVSFRHMDTILLVAGDDGRILWRFGGKHNDYVMEGGFKFSRQHHARYISHSPERDVISFLDNASGEQLIDLQPPSNNYSRGLIVELSRPRDGPKRARILHEYKRPDRRLADRRGSLQRLENGNVLMAWTDAGYISEHTADDKVVMEARFLNETRLGIYRAYKSTNWVGRPKQPPDVKAFGYYGIGGTEKGVTAIYVSWNGATEHRTWRFFADDGVFLGQTNRTGFETVFVTDEPTTLVRAHAFDRDGVFLGKSLDVPTEYATGWMPLPADPLLAGSTVPPPPPPPPPSKDIVNPRPLDDETAKPPATIDEIIPYPPPPPPVDPIPVNNEKIPPPTADSNLPPPPPPAAEKVDVKPVGEKVDKILLPPPLPPPEEKLASPIPPPADPITVTVTTTAIPTAIPTPTPQAGSDPASDILLNPIHQDQSAQPPSPPPPPPPPPPPTSDSRPSSSSPSSTAETQQRHQTNSTSDSGYKDNPLYIGVLGIPCAVGWFVILRLLYRQIRYLVASQFGIGGGGRKDGYIEVPAVYEY